MVDKIKIVKIELDEIDTIKNLSGEIAEAIAKKKSAEIDKIITLLLKKYGFSNYQEAIANGYLIMCHKINNEIEEIKIVKVLDVEQVNFTFSIR